MIIDITDDVYVVADKLKKVTVIDLIAGTVITEDGSIFSLKDSMVANILKGEENEEN